MSQRRSKTRLSVGEMEVMHMLWTNGELSLSEAHQALGRDIGYTTMQTRLNRLVDKGLAARSDGRPAKYRAAIAREAVSASHLDVLVERVSGGSIVPLVAQLVSSRPLPPEQIRELKALIAEAEKVSTQTSEGQDSHDI